MTYPNGTTTASDLLAINIQRGRDHGLQPYYKYVQACTGKTITSFDNLSTLMSSSNYIFFLKF
jgi:peroxidase